MYAVIIAGGKQHRVTEGERLRVDYLSGKQNGDKLVFEDVLMIGGETYQVGKPTVPGARVEASVVDNGPDGEGQKGEKLWAFKKRRRKGYSKIRGHRSLYTVLRIDKISA